MSSSAATPAPPGASPVVLAVALTLLAQTLLALALLGPAVLAPAAAQALELPPERIGVVMTIIYLTAMFAGLAGGALVSRFGPLRVCQIALVVAALGLAAGGIGSVVAILAGALAVGSGYGVVNPATSTILARVSPPSMLAFILSLKQTGVPLGGVIAGAVLPTLALVYGWQVAIHAIAASCFVLAIACEPARRSIDGANRAHQAHAGDDASAGAGERVRSVVAGIVAPIRLVWRTPALRETAIASIAYAGTQMMLFTFLVTYANLGLGHSLVVAGAVYSAAQMAGIGGRIVWGTIADRMRRPRRLLGALGIASALLTLALVTTGAHWSISGLTVVCALLGSVAIGWNGIYFAEVVRSSPPDKVGLATGGAQFFTFFGALSGPAGAGLIVSFTGSYAIAMGTIALSALVMGVVLMWRSR